MSNLLLDEFGLIPFPVQKVSACPVCDGGYMIFEHDTSRLEDEPYILFCHHCGFKSTGKTWREALWRWNAGKGETNKTIEVDSNER